MKLKKNSVYAVVNVSTGYVVDATTDRDVARSTLQFVKSSSDNPKNFKIAKMTTIEKWIR